MHSQQQGCGAVPRGGIGARTVRGGVSQTAPRPPPLPLCRDTFARDTTTASGNLVSAWRWPAWPGDRQTGGTLLERTAFLEWPHATDIRTRQKRVFLSSVSV